MLNIDHITRTCRHFSSPRYLFVCAIFASTLCLVWCIVTYRVSLLISTLYRMRIFSNQFVRVTLLSALSILVNNEVDHRNVFFPLPPVDFFFLVRKRAVEFWKIRRTKLRWESNPARISSSSFGEKFIAFIPAAETDLGFTFVVTFQSTWSFNEISGKLRATRIVVVVAERPERTVLHPFHFSLETATVSRIYKKYSTLFFDMDIESLLQDVI